MENLVQYLAEQLVDHPEDVKTNRVEAGNGDVTIELRVHAEDMGKVIGKQGRIAKSIRTLVKARLPKKTNRSIILWIFWNETNAAESWIYLKTAGDKRRTENTAVDRRCKAF